MRGCSLGSCFCYPGVALWEGGKFYPFLLKSSHLTLWAVNHYSRSQCGNHFSRFWAVDKKLWTALEIVGLLEERKSCAWGNAEVLLKPMSAGSCLSTHDLMYRRRDSIYPVWQSSSLWDFRWRLGRVEWKGSTSPYSIWINCGIARRYCGLKEKTTNGN